MIKSTIFRRGSGVGRGGEEEDVTCAEAGAGETGEAGGGDGAAGLHSHGHGGGHGADHGGDRPTHSEYIQTHLV